MTAHPATFSTPVLDQIKLDLARHVPLGGRVLDPFAGIGTIHELRPAWFTWGIELEPEWAAEDAMTFCGSVLAASNWFLDGTFDAIATSPCYGNRMADHHEARDTSKRNTYRHQLGRPLTEGSSAGLQWGEPYRDFHRQAWAEVVPLLKPGGIFILNVSDHIRRGKRMPVEAFHLAELMHLGLHLVEARRVTTARQGFGANRLARVDGELIAVLKVTR